jgi:uncharacterized protein (TIGR03435 family)
MMPGYAMLVAPNGPKIKSSGAAGEASSFDARGAAINKLDSADQKNTALNTIVGRKMTMEELARALSRLPDATPVADATGMAGTFDFTLEWEPDEELPRVVQEQLGLRLERRQVPVDFIVIDAAEHPVVD